MQSIRQFFRSRKANISDALWCDILACLPYLRRLPAQDKDRLRDLCESLLQRTTFTGAGGFEMTGEVAAMIAVQACLPVLNLTLDLYQDMAGVIVYPSEFIIPHSEIDEAGVVHEWLAPASGEAIDAGGAVVLSWEDANPVQQLDYNVVIHEFVHKIDMADGQANGCPLFLAAFHQEISAARWQSSFSAAFEDFVQRLDDIDAQLPEDFDATCPSHGLDYDALCSTLPLDPYAGNHPAEFFAVASEAFFIRPQPLAAAYPDIYRLLKIYYQQDPLSVLNV